MGFGLFRGLVDNLRGGTQAQRPQASPEDIEAQEEKQKQLLEDAARRRAREAEAERERRRVERLAKARESISILEDR